MNRATFRMLSALERQRVSTPPELRDSRARYEPTLHLGLPRSKEGRRRRRWWWFTCVVFPIGMVFALIYVIARIAGVL